MQRTITIIGLMLGIISLPASTAAAASPESEIVNMINQERAQRGYEGLIMRDDLSAIAERHSRRMQERNELYHNRNLGDEIPGEWERAGENVGVGPDVYTLHDAFMSSSGHRANILGSFNEIGVGVVTDPSGEVYVTQVFVQRARRSSASSGSSSPKPKPSRSKPAPESGSEEPTSTRSGSSGHSAKPSEPSKPAHEAAPKPEPRQESPAKEPTPALVSKTEDRGASRAVDLLLRVVTFQD